MVNSLVIVIDFLLTSCHSIILMEESPGWDLSASWGRQIFTTHTKRRAISTVASPLISFFPHHYLFVLTLSTTKYLYLGCWLEGCWLYSIGTCTYTSLNHTYYTSQTNNNKFHYSAISECVLWPLLPASYAVLINPWQIFPLLTPFYHQLCVLAIKVQWAIATISLLKPLWPWGGCSHPPGRTNQPDEMGRSIWHHCHTLPVQFLGRGDSLGLKVVWMVTVVIREDPGFYETFLVSPFWIRFDALTLRPSITIILGESGSIVPSSQTFSHWDC